MMLKRHLKVSDDKCRAGAAVLINNARACRDFDYSMMFIVREIGLVTGEFMEEFIPFYAELNNCTGKWALKGHTPNEITKIMNPDLYNAAQSMYEGKRGMAEIMPFKIPGDAKRKGISAEGFKNKYLN